MEEMQSRFFLRLLTNVPIDKNTIELDVNPRRDDDASLTLS